MCVALPADNATLTLPIFDTVINGKTVIGSIVGTRNDLSDVFALHAAGRTRVIAVDRKIDEVNQSIDDVLAGMSQPVSSSSSDCPNSEPRSARSRPLRGRAHAPN